LPAGTAPPRAALHGIGGHAHAEFAIPVIGAAKPAFRTAIPAIPVRRGTSGRPVFVTAAGIPAPARLSWCGSWLAGSGVPGALRRADQLARTGPSAAIHKSHRPG
jgi:deoxyribonuclease V